jgi:hypothetical protein
MELSQELAEPVQPPASSWRRRFFTPLLTPLLAMAIIALVFFGGVRNGMDHVAAQLENDQWSIAVALSDLVYGLNAGYLGYASVLDKLVEVWNAGLDPHSPLLANRNKDRDVLNKAISAAASLGPQPPGFIADRTLITLIYSDVGYVDFTKLAFRIFGYKIESLYYAFFLLLSLSAAAYLIVFWSQPGAKMALLCALFAFFVELHTIVFTPDMPTFHGMRHGSTLALIPAWHFAFLLIYRRRPSLVTVLATLIQLAILISAIKTRGSAGWTLVFVAAIAVVVGYLQWRKAQTDARTWPRLAREVVRWPILLLFGGLFAYSQYENIKLHPVYFTDDVLPHHGFWHTAYAGLLDMPGLVPQGSEAMKLHDAGAVDSATYAAAAEYLRDSRFIPLPAGYPQVVAPSFISPWTGTLKFKLFDDIMRRVVVHTWMQRPLLSLKLYLYIRPIALVHVVRMAIGGAPNVDWLWYLLIGGVSVFSIISIADGLQDAYRLAVPLCAVAGALPFAALPNIWGYAQFHTIADALLVTLVLLQLLVCVVVALAAMPIRRRRMSPPSTVKGDAMAGARDA